MRRLGLVILSVAALFPFAAFAHTSLEGDTVKVISMNPETLTPNRFTTGIFAGGGYLFNTGSLHNNFGHTPIITMGLLFGYKKFMNKIDVSYGQPFFRNNAIFTDFVIRPGEEDNVYKYQISKNTTSYASYLGISYQVGLKVINTRRLAITPHAGLYYSNYNWSQDIYGWDRNEQNDWESVVTDRGGVSMSSYGFIASIDFDIALYHRYSPMISLEGNGVKDFSSNLRITPFVARESFTKCTPDIKGWIAGISVCYYAMFRNLF